MVHEHGLVDAKAPRSPVAVVEVNDIGLFDEGRDLVVVLAPDQIMGELEIRVVLPRGRADAEVGRLLSGSLKSRHDSRRIGAADGEGFRDLRLMAVPSGRVGITGVLPVRFLRCAHDDRVH